MNKRVSLILAIVATGTTLAETAKFTALVLDDVTGEPMTNVQICGTFSMRYNDWDAAKGSPGPNRVYGVTDSNGRCALRGETNLGHAGFYIKNAHEGYYWQRQGAGHDYDKFENGVCQPDNLVLTVRLQRVIHPIPLRVQKVELDAKREIGEVNDGKFSFDFVKGDWLPPHGTGEVADVVFKRLPRRSLGEEKRRYLTIKFYRDEVTVEFPGVGNGIQVVDTDGRYPKIQVAPEKGYGKSYSCWCGRSVPPEEDWSYDEDRCFGFRIRSRQDESGKLTEALYGKIYSDFKICTLGHEGVCGIKFTYYLNPTSLDRNLEYDRINNLDPNADIDMQFEP